MAAPAGPPRVVVGVDPSEYAATALDRAATEAELRAWPLEIVHAAGAGASRLAQAGGRSWQEAHRAAQLLLEDAERRARGGHGTLTVRTTLVDDAPLPGLLGTVRPEDLLVVGSRGYGRLTSLVLGSVSQGLAAHAPCPVVVVPARGAGLPGAPVVLGAGPGESPGTVEFAFAEAAWRGSPLLAVRARSGNSPGPAATPSGDQGARDRAQPEDLAALLAAAREVRPDVVVQTRVGESAPEALLTRASENAWMVVLGAQRPHGRLSPPLGRVVQRVLHQALCPVALVPQS